MATTKAKKVSKANQKHVFSYVGVDRKGNKIKGEYEANNVAAVKSQLKRQGINPKRVSKKGKPLLGGGMGKVTPMDVAIFARQLATMMKAGVPLIQSFEIVGEGLDNKAMAALVLDIKNDVSGGGNLAGSLSKHPKHFDELFCNLVNSGEQSGALETMLDRVATYKEKSEALKNKIKKAMNYPVAVIAVAVVVTGILLVKVVPQFAETFSSFGADLPAFTLMVMAMSEWMQANWFICIALIVAAVIAHKEASQRSKKYRDSIDALMIKMPIIGVIVNQSVYARFARTLSTTFAAGVPLVEALDSVAGAAGNEIYARAIKKVRDDVTTGTPLHASMKETGMFPGMMLQMVSIGEESGALDSMLDKVATHYEAEVDNAVDSLTSLMEPLIMSVLGVLVGGLMIAMYLPIFMIGQTI